MEGGGGEREAWKKEKTIGLHRYRVGWKITDTFFCYCYIVWHLLHVTGCPSVSLYLRHSYEGDWFLVLFVVLPASEVLQFVSQNLVHVCVCACVCVCVCMCVCACVHVCV